MSQLFAIIENPHYLGATVGLLSGSLLGAAQAVQEPKKAFWSFYYPAILAPAVSLIGFAPAPLRAPIYLCYSAWFLQTLNSEIKMMTAEEGKDQYECHAKEIERQRLLEQQRHLDRKSEGLETFVEQEEEE